MAGRSAVLAIRIVSDASRASEGFDQAQNRAERFQAGLDRASVAAVGVIGAIGAVATAAYQSASELEQAGGAVESVFKGQAAAVNELARAAAQSVGLATSQYSNLAAVLGSQLMNLGVSQESVVGTTDQLIKLGADLAATYGGTTAEAVEALSALFRGEGDSMERYAVSINQAAVEAELAAQGLDKLEGSARTQAETQARLTLVMRQTADAQGAFAREAGTAAGQQARFAAELENASAALGAVLLPLVSQLAQALSGVATFASQNTGLFQGLAAAALGVAAAVLAVNGAIKVYQAASAVVGATAAAWRLVQAAATSAALQTGLLWARILAMYVAQTVASAATAAAAWVASAARTVGALALQGAAFVAQRAVMIAGAVATGVMTAAQWALNAALSANPIGIIIIAVVALVAAIVLAYNNCETFRSIVQAVAGAAVAAWNWIVDAVRALINWVGQVIDRVRSMSGVQHVINGVKIAFQAITSPISTIIGLVQSLIGWISRIRFPSPPAWVSGLFGSGPDPALIGVPRMDSFLRFLPPPHLEAAAPPPALTAAMDGHPLAALARLQSGETHVSNVTINVQVDGALDPLAVGRQIQDVLAKYVRTSGQGLALQIGGR
jgi:hypothetical protein